MVAEVGMAAKVATPASNMAADSSMTAEAAGQRTAAWLHTAT
jgi:hypothetical protein